jgi:hypothetical protein
MYKINFSRGKVLKSKNGALGHLQLVVADEEEIDVYFFL